MPVHLVAPFAAAAAWGALQDCEGGGSRDSPRTYQEDFEEGEDDNIEMAIEQRLSSSYVMVDGSATERNSGDENDLDSNGERRRARRRRSQEEENDESAYPQPSIQHSTSTFGENNTPAGMSFSEHPASLRMMNSFNAGGGIAGGGAAAATVPGGPNNIVTTKLQLQQQGNQRSVQLRRGNSQCSVDSLLVGNSLAGFVDGDFASGKVRDIPVDGCFVMQFVPVAQSLLAVGARKSIDFYETTSYSMAYRLPQEKQVSALQWLPMAKHQGKKSLGRNLLAVGDLAGNVTLLQVADELLEMYGPTIVHKFNVDDQIRSIDLQFMGENTILLAVGDKSGKITFSMYSLELEPIANYVAYNIDNGKVLSLAIQSQQALLAISTMDGEAMVHKLEQDETKMWHLVQQRLFSRQRRGAVRSVTFSPTGNLLALGGYDKTLVLVDTCLWAVVREHTLEGTINTIEFDPYDRYLAVGTRDKSFVLFDTSTWMPI